MYSITLTNNSGYSQFEAGLDPTYSAEFSSRSDLSEKSSVDLPDGRVSSATVNRRDLKSSTTYTQGMFDVWVCPKEKNLSVSLFLCLSLSSLSLSVFMCYVDSYFQLDLSICILNLPLFAQEWLKRQLLILWLDFGLLHEMLIWEYVRQCLWSIPNMLDIDLRSIPNLWFELNGSVLCKLLFWWSGAIKTDFMIITDTKVVRCCGSGSRTELKKRIWLLAHKQE